MLAQAYFPDDVNRSTIAGDIQFDSAESWEVGNSQGSQAFDLLYVAVHEIGHALGLEHSDAPGSVLNDTLSPNQQFTGLTDADRDAALALYAPAVEPTVPVDPPKTPSDSETPTEPTEQPPIDPSDETPTTEQPPVDPEPDDPIDSEPTDRWNTRWRRFLGRFGKRRFFSIDFSDNFDRFDTSNIPNISEVTNRQFRTSIPWSIGFRR